jgi:hypothetical protein
MTAPDNETVPQKLSERLEQGLGNETEALRQRVVELERELDIAFHMVESLRARLCNALELNHRSTRDMDILDNIRRLKAEAGKEADGG